MDYLNQIHNIIEELIAKPEFKPNFRSPLIGCAAADDPIFNGIKAITHEGHMLPEDLLPGALSVIAFFLPYNQGIVQSNLQAKKVSREWAVAYVETNKLISDICLETRSIFEAEGIRIAWEQPTYSFDKQKLMSTWSHRHAAYAAGLGTFGLNNLLITDAGCAGRVGSFVIDAYIPPTKRTNREKCLYKQSDKCGECITLCPTGALTKEGLDRHRCYQWLLKWDNYYADLPLTDVCGKCSLGRCSIST